MIIKYIGITCFSENWNSTLMWSYYGENHTGYCIGLDEKYIRFSMLFGKMARVKYSNKYPDLNPFDKDTNDLLLKYFFKSLDWKYEKEIRLMNIYDEENSNRIIVLDSKYIKEIMLGINISKDSKNEITSIAKDKNIPVWQCFKDKLKIERYQLE